MNNTADDCAYEFKLVIVGDSNVGKSSLLMRLIDRSFSIDHFTTIGADCKMKHIYLGDESCRLQIWDTAGQERFESIATSFYRGAHGIILVYDVSDRKSFESVTKVWLRQVENSVNGRDLNMILVGNKRDVPDSRRVVARWEGEILAQQLDIRYLESSAKSFVNIERIFTSIATDIKTTVDFTNSPQENDSITLGSNSFRQPANNYDPRSGRLSKRTLSACRPRRINHRSCGC